MGFMLIAYEFCLIIALSNEIFKINSVSAFVFPEIKFSIPKVGLTDLFSLIKSKIPEFHSNNFLCSNDIKHSVLIFNQLASNLHKKFSVFIQNPNDLFSRFKIDKFSWNWTKWYSNFCRSKFNAADFSYDIEKELFGQHIASWSLPRLLNNHLRKKKSVKPLLMSFHGPTGSGKSLATKIIVQNLFQEGFNSKFVHTYYGSQDFFHEKEKENYRKRLLQEIPFFLSLCDRSVFIFEEMDQMVPGVIDVILPFIYFDENSTDTFSTNSIFIFVSNSGAKRMEEMVYDAWLQGVPREDMILDDFSSCLNATVYKEPGALQYSEIIKRNLIDAFLPFLPLEKKHVKQCILRELKLHEMSTDNNVVKYVANQITYHPSEFELFAESGCKRVSHKVELYGEY